MRGWVFSSRLCSAPALVSVIGIAPLFNWGCPSGHFGTQEAPSKILASKSVQWLRPDRRRWPRAGGMLLRVPRDLREPEVPGRASDGATRRREETLQIYLLEKWRRIDLEQLRFASRARSFVDPLKGTVPCRSYALIRRINDRG